MKKSIAAIAAGLALCASAAQAQEAPIETQAIRCAAMAYVLTSLPMDSPQFGQAMADIGALFGSVYSLTYDNRINGSSTMGDVFGRREPVLQEFQQSWKTNADGVASEAALCNMWRGAIVARLGEVGIDELTPANIREVPTVPSRLPRADIEKWKPLTQRAFVAWAATDYLTPNKLREKLRERLSPPKP